ncbi:MULTISPECIES: HEAT repeat domain-containing protein [Streptomyces]|uniref:HEAT repeat domain-containing protein n=1 Tax=Streptomyces glycanivorans TaxID=3033808 RepID=A0ABY9J642_9ACTN|nr:HEAT repeat domain-containing protein [Streptomyces sp. Alt3]WLQ62334.1 HEAT repeat domain-containing protein [Streptomyces sp. Alt3]
MLLARIAEAGDSGEPVVPREVPHRFATRRRGPLDRLTPLAAHPDPAVREDLVWTVGSWSTPGVGQLLDGLAEDPSPDVREAVEAIREP